MIKVSGGSSFKNKDGTTHYSKNKQYYLDKNKKIIIRNRKFINEYKKTHPCVDCGFSDIRVLDFDHKSSEKKFMVLTRMAGDCYSIERLKKEIKKCDVRCANCHRIKTSQRRNKPL